MRKTVLKKLILVALLSMVVPATGFAADTIKIGVAGPHTGDLAPYGIPTKEAAEMVAEKINASGGVLGKQVEAVGTEWRPAAVRPSRRAELHRRHPGRARSQSRARHALPPAGGGGRCRLGHPQAAGNRPVVLGLRPARHRLCCEV